MNPPVPSSPESAAAPGDAAPPGTAPRTPSSPPLSPPLSPALRWLVPVTVPVAVLSTVLAAAALALVFSAEQRVTQLESEIGKRQAEMAAAANEARTLARQAETASREVAAKMALLEARLAETMMQRSQFEDLLQSLARSRDENVLADVEAAVRVAQQQSAITGSAEPLLLVLRQAEERLARYNQPRLERVRRAIAQDLERTRTAGVSDLSVLTIRLDELVRQVDELPLLVTPAHPAAGARAGSVAAGAQPAAASASMSPAAATTAAATPASTASASRTAPAAGTPAFVDTLNRAWAGLSQQVWAEARSLLRVTRIGDPEAILIAPEQAYFLRENLKLRLLNARLALLSRQFDIAQSDLRESLAALERYFERGARRTTVFAEGLRQVLAQARSVAPPRPDATLAAIATALAGR